MQVTISGYAVEEMQKHAQARAIPGTIEFDGEKFTFEILDEPIIENELGA